MPIAWDNMSLEQGIHNTSIYDFDMASVIKQECLNKPLVGKLICFFCDKEFRCKEDLQSHQDQCALRSPGLQSFLVKTQNNRGEKRAFLGAFGLVPKGRDDFLKSDKRNDVIVDIIVIDDDSDDEIKQSISCEKSSRYLLSPTRQDSSDSGIIDKLRPKKLCFDRNSPGGAFTKNSSMVFKIDLSSPLGVRLRYHSKAIDNSKQVFINRIIANYDDYCGKLSMQMAKRLSWNEFFPVTFKKSRLFSSNYCHSFKFTRTELKEFCTEISRCLRTGLCLRARRLKRRMKPCSVLLDKMDLPCEDGKLINQTFTIEITDTVNSKSYQRYYEVIEIDGTWKRNGESDVNYNKSDLSGFQQNPVGFSNNQISSIDMKSFLSSNETGNPHHAAASNCKSFVSFIGNLTETASHYPKSMAFIPMPLLSCQMPTKPEQMNGVEKEKFSGNEEQISLLGGMSSTNDKNTLSEKIALNDLQVSQKNRVFGNDNQILVSAEMSQTNDDDCRSENRLFQISSVFSLATNQKNTLLKNSRNDDSIILSSENLLLSKNALPLLLDGEVISLSDGESRQSSKENATEDVQTETSGQVKDVSDKVTIIDLTENISSVHEPLQNSTLITSEKCFKAQRDRNMPLRHIVPGNDGKLQVFGRLQNPTNLTLLHSKQMNILEKVAEILIPPKQIIKPTVIEILDEDSVSALPQSKNSEISSDDPRLSVSSRSPSSIAVAQWSRNLQERNIEFSNREHRPSENAPLNSGGIAVQRSTLNQNLLPSENVPIISRITNASCIVQRKDNTKDYSSGDMIDLSIDSDCETMSEDCTEIRNELASNGLKRDNWSANSPDFIPIKRKKTNGEVLLENSVLGPLSFKCHICGSLFNLDANASSVIQSHYSTHNVTNIKLVQQRLPNGQLSWNLVELANSVSSLSINPDTGTTLSKFGEKQHQSRPTFFSSSSQQHLSPTNNIPTSGTSPTGRMLQVPVSRPIGPNSTRAVIQFGQRPLLSTNHVLQVGDDVHRRSSSSQRQQYTGSDQNSAMTSFVEDISNQKSCPNNEMSLPQKKTISSVQTSSHDSNNYILYGPMVQPAPVANGRRESPSSVSRNVTTTTSAWNSASRLENLQQSAVEKDMVHLSRSQLPHPLQIVKNNLNIPTCVEWHDCGTSMEGANGIKNSRNISQATNRSNACVSVISDNNVNNVICLD